VADYTLTLDVQTYELATAGAIGASLSLRAPPQLVAIVSEQGPAGPPPTRYLHAQTVASTEWIVNHNLGRCPAMVVMTPGGLVVDAEIVCVSPNQCRVLLAMPMTGSCACS
jgi:hypothetical protein